MNYRKMPNGSLVAPRRGRPPAVPDGYERAEGDNYTFLPILTDCDHRSTRIEKTGCCDKIIRQCGIIDANVSRVQCSECKGNPEWIRQSTSATTQEEPDMNKNPKS